MKQETAKINLLTLLRRSYPIFFKACPAYLVCMFFMNFLHGLVWGVNVYVEANLFDSVANAAAGIGGLPQILWMVGATGAMAVVKQVLNGVANFMGNNVFIRENGHFEQCIIEKAARLDPVVYEQADTLDDINKAREGAGGVSNLCFTLLNLFLFYIPCLAFVGWYLFTLKPLLAISLLLIFIPVVISQLIRGIVFAKYEDNAAPLRREMEYYESAVCGRELFKETRLLGGFRFFRRKFLTSLRELNRASWKAERKTGLWELFMKVLTLLGYGGVLLLLVDALLKGEITVGAFAAVFSSLGMIYSLMEEVVAGHFGRVARQLGAVRNFIRFLDLPERSGDMEEAKPDEGGIVAEHVSFTYPGAKEASLRDVSLAIHPGETVAVVGQNGAGKTTLVKLLTGLYLPLEGEIRIGGRSTRTTAPRQLFAQVSGVFQQYGRYKMTLRENICIGDCETGEAEERTTAAAQGADVAVNSEAYPEGLDTMLAKEFDGVDVSGGQWQRIAIARGLYRTHRFIVLDEPTSAIDPVEESRIYQKFAAISKGKTSLIVTHRLGSARIADRIIVMADGCVAECGSHDELVAKGGKYAEMWAAQAQYYV